MSERRSSSGGDMSRESTLFSERQRLEREEEGVQGHTLRQRERQERQRQETLRLREELEDEKWRLERWKERQTAREQKQQSFLMQEDQRSSLQKEHRIGPGKLEEQIRPGLIEPHSDMGYIEPGSLEDPPSRTDPTGPHIESGSFPKSPETAEQNDHEVELDMSRILERLASVTDLSGPRPHEEAFTTRDFEHILRQLTFDKHDGDYGETASMLSFNYARAVMIVTLIYNLTRSFLLDAANNPVKRDDFTRLLWLTDLAARCYLGKRLRVRREEPLARHMLQQVKDIETSRKRPPDMRESIRLVSHRTARRIITIDYVIKSFTRMTTALDESGAVTTFELSLRWDPIGFLSREWPAMPAELSKTITYCGNASYAYAASVSEYLHMYWPRIPGLADALSSCVQRVCSDSSKSGKVEVAGVEISLHVANGETHIVLTGLATSVVEIAEACTWLSVACRSNPVENTVGYCTPVFFAVDAKETYAEALEVAPTYRETPIEHARQGTGGLCWVKMVRNPVIVRGYPIPRRDEPAEEKGLEAPLDMLIALSAASWATTFGQQFLLKGTVSALVPVTTSSSSVTWHFALNEDGERMQYHKACSGLNKIGPLDLDLAALATKRHFVGLWTPSARFIVGSGKHNLFPLKLSQSEAAEGYECELSNVSIAGGKYLTVGLSFKIGRKDIAPAIASAQRRPFDLQMRQASDISVLFYGTNDRRGWLLDGSSALLHLATSWMASEHAESMPKDVLKKFQPIDQTGGRSAARLCLLANASRQLTSLSGPKSTSDEDLLPEGLPSGDLGHLERDSGYSTGRDSRSSNSTNYADERWTFKDLVLDLWRALEAMQDAIHFARSTAPSFPLSPKRLVASSPLLVGWDAKKVISSPRHIYPRAVKLHAGAEQWVRLIRDESAIVLMAKTFGDLMVPKDEGECIRLSRMPPQLDLLAVPFHLLQRFAERWREDGDDTSSGCVQITDNLYWYGFDARPNPCQCSDTDECNVLSRLSSIPRHYKQLARQKSAVQPGDIFREYPLGIALLGGSNRVKNGPTLPRLPFKSAFGALDGEDRTGPGRVPNVNSGESQVVDHQFTANQTPPTSSLASSSSASPRHEFTVSSRVYGVPQLSYQRDFTERVETQSLPRSFESHSYREGLAAAASLASPSFGNMSERGDQQSEDED